MGDNKTSWVFLAFILFYLVQGIFSIFLENFAKPLDIFAATAVIALFFLLHHFVKLKSIVPLMLGIGLFPHIIGLYKIIPYNHGYIGTLYGWAGFNYQYDLFVHFFAIFCFSVAFCSIFHPYLIKGLKSKFLMFIVALFFVIGVGGLNEVIEYVGYDAFGYGEGFLEYGEGDDTPTSGPWKDSCTDLIANIFGGVIGIGGFILIKKQD